jgi:hypothetical protein
MSRIVFELNEKKYSVDAVVLDQTMPIMLPGGRFICINRWGSEIDGVYQVTEVQDIGATDLEDFGGHSMAEATSISSTFDCRKEPSLSRMWPSAPQNS